MFEFLLGFFNFLEEKLLRVIEESISLETLRHTQIHICFSNSKIPPLMTLDLLYMQPNLQDNHEGHYNHAQEDYLQVITKEKFGFLLNREIHDVVGMTKEGIHTIKSSNSPMIVMKIDLSKVYDKVNWIYLRLLLLQIGMDLQFVN